MGNPWFKFYPSDWLGGTRDLKPAELGIYINLIASMYDRGAPLKDDIKLLCRQCGATPRQMEKALPELLESGKIVLVEGGFWSARVERELETGFICVSKVVHKRDTKVSSEPEKTFKNKAPKSPIPEARSQKPEPEKKVPKKKIQIPDGFPDAEALAMAAKIVANPKTVAEGFRDNCLANGRTYIDWTAAFRNWCNNAVSKYGEPAARKFGSSIQLTDRQWSNVVSHWKADPRNWQIMKYGPSPGEPGCLVPAHILVNAA